MAAQPKPVPAISLDMQSYIANLPIGAYRPALRRLDDEKVAALDIDNLPDGVVTGSNLIQFSKEASPEIRSSVALSLLAAQRVATVDPVLVTPQDWVERHNTVLRNLNWRVGAGGFVESKFDNVNVALHEAIIPFLTSVFGPIGAAGSLIITALKQLKEMDKNSPWITLFDRESRHFNVTQYQFSMVQVVGNDVTLKLACARLNAFYGLTQVLFIKVKEESAKFEAANQELKTDPYFLAEMNKDLKAKLAQFAKEEVLRIPLS